MKFKVTIIIDSEFEDEDVVSIENAVRTGLEMEFGTNEEIKSIEVEEIL
jgi:hypothetical protein